jgi:hypothetical protein
MIIANACEKRSHFFDAAPALGRAIILHEDFAGQLCARFCSRKHLAFTNTIAIANIHKGAHRECSKADAFESHSQLASGASYCKCLAIKIHAALALNTQRHAHAPANAQSGKTAFGIARRHFMQQGHKHTRP